jgi:hypothetical protein
VALTDWVSNLVPVNKKQGTIHVCVYCRDINKSCPKDNYPTPFIDDCIGTKIFSLMDGFFSYNKINILPADQHKTDFICPWGTFAYWKLLFSLKTPVQHFNAPCLMLFMISSTSYNHISMIYQHIPCVAKIT